MNDLPMPARIAAAMALLEADQPDGYDDLPATQRVHYQEAIEHLRSLAGGFPGRDA